MDRPPVDRAREAARLAAIRGRVAALAGVEWLLSADGEAMLLDSRAADRSIVTVARFTPLATQEEMEVATGALDDLRFLLGLVDRAIAAERARRPRDAPPEPERQAGGGHAPPDHTTEAAMLCSAPAFKRWLIDCHGLDSPATDERAAQKLRSLLGVTSRKEINQSEAVRARWIALREGFRAWKRRAA